MKKKLISAACTAAIAFVCACQPKASATMPSDDNKSNDSDKPKSGCCETEKPKTVAASEASKPAAGSCETAKPKPAVVPEASKPAAGSCETEKPKTVAVPEIKAQ